MHARVDPGNVCAPARLDENGLAAFTQFLHERQHVPLQEWFTSGDFRRAGSRRPAPLNDRRKRAVLEPE